jgi:hypothetical protein
MLGILWVSEQYWVLMDSALQSVKISLSYWQKKWKLFNKSQRQENKLWITIVRKMLFNLLHRQAHNQYIIGVRSGRFVDHDYHVLGCYTLQSGRPLPTFQRNLLHPSSTLKVEAAGSSEILIMIYHTTQCHISEDSNLHSHCHKNFRSNFTDQIKQSAMKVFKQLLSFFGYYPLPLLFKPQRPAMSKNSIIVLIYHHHKLLHSFHGSSQPSK